MTVTRIYAAGHGESDFEDGQIDLADAGTIGWLSAPQPAVSVVFRENGPGYDYDWHPAPCRQYVVLLDGEIEIEVSTGRKRRFAGGQILLVEDTTGKGHRTRHT